MLLVSVACWIGAGCSKPAEGSAGAASTLPSSAASSNAIAAASPPVRLAITDAVNAGVSLAANGSTVVAVWAAITDGRANIYAAVSRDGAATFEAPVRVNDRDGDARFSGEQAPRVAIGKDIAVVWPSRQGSTSVIRLARSADGGRTFSHATTVHAGALTGARGWASLSAGPSGDVRVAWLDGRNANAGSHDAAAHGEAAHDAAEHAQAAAHEMHEAMRQDIVFARIAADGERTESSVATNVCFCCKTSVVTSASGAIHVAWRHIFPTNLRDIAVGTSTDGGKTFSAPVRVSEDHWQIAGCPEDGPALAAGDAALHIAWSTMTEATPPQKVVFYSYSTDGGHSFAPRVRLDTGAGAETVAAHAQIVSAGARVFATWDESAESRHRIQVREITSKPGAASWTPDLHAAVTFGADAPATYPAIVALPDGLVLAWTNNAPSGSGVIVQRLRR